MTWVVTRDGIKSEEELANNFYDEMYGELVGEARYYYCIGCDFTYFTFKALPPPRCPKCLKP